MTDNEDEFVAPATASDTPHQRIGSIIRAARENSGYSLEQVSKETRVHLSHLRAIEDMTPNLLGAPVYAKDYIKSYARFLGMDEQITLDRGAAHLKDELMPRYAGIIYNGFWFAPEREMLQAAIDHSQEKVAGTVRLKLYKGSVIVTGRKSPFSLYSEKVVTFEDDQGAYDQRDAAGFIKLNALRLRLLGRRDR